MESDSEPRVFIVGAGPGAPGLLTLRAAELLAKADLVLYDQLVPKRLLDFARAGAEVVCVRDLPGTHPDKSSHILALLIARELRKFGKDPATPAAIVERASPGDMRTIAAPLADLEAKRRQAGLEAPGLILIGEAIDHRAAVSWFEARPLFGTRVLVTRPRHQPRPMI